MDRPRPHIVKPGPPNSQELAQKAEREKWRAHNAALSLLQQSEGWQTYRTLLEDMEKTVLQAMVTGGKDQHDHWAGYIQGLRAAFNLPETIAQKMRELT